MTDAGSAAFAADPAVIPLARAAGVRTAGVVAAGTDPVPHPWCGRGCPAPTWWPARPSPPIPRSGGNWPRSGWSTSRPSSRGTGRLLGLLRFFAAGPPEPWRRYVAPAYDPSWT